MLKKHTPEVPESLKTVLKISGNHGNVSVNFLLSYFVLVKFQVWSIVKTYLFWLTYEFANGLYNKESRHSLMMTYRETFWTT